MYSIPGVTAGPEVVPTWQHAPPPGLAVGLLGLGRRRRAGFGRGRSSHRVLVSVQRERPAASLGLERLPVEVGLEEPRERVELHQVVDLPLCRLEEAGLRGLEAVVGRAAGVRVDVDRVAGAGGQVASQDLVGRQAALAHAGQGAVALARRPEVDILVAKLLLQKLL